MTSSIGSASVRIVPDLEGFNRTINLALERGDFDVPAEVDPAHLAASLEVAEELLDELDLDVDLDAAQIAAQVEGIQRTLPDLDVDADIDETGLRSRMTATIAGLSKTLPPVFLRVNTARALAAVAAFEATTGRVLRRLGTASLFAGAGFAGVTAVGTGAAIVNLAEFDDKLTQSLAIVSDVTPEMRAEFEETAKEIARTTRFGADQAAEAYFFLASAGLDAEQQLAALPVVAQGAQAGMFDLATATDLFTDAASAVGLSVTDAQSGIENLTRTQDVFVKANLLANATVEQFSESITNKAGAQLRAFDKDLEEGTAVLAAFADQGVKGRRAGEQLNIVMRDLGSFAEKNAEEFAQLGIEVFDSSGSMRNMADIVEDFEEVLGPMSDSARAAAFAQLGLGQQSADAVTQLLGTSDAIRRYERNLRQAGGTAETVAEAQLGSVSAALDLIKNNIEVAGLALATPLANRIKELLTTNREAFSAFFASVEARAEAFGESVLGFVEGALAFIRSPEFIAFLGQVREGFSVLGEAVDAFVRSFTAGLGNSEAAGGSFIEALGAAFVGVAEIVRDVAPAVGNVLGRLASFLGDNESSVKGFAKAWLGAFAIVKGLRFVKFLVTPFLVLLKPLGSAILQLVRLPKLLKSGGELTRFQSIIASIGRFLAAVGRNALSFGKFLVGAFRSVGSRVLPVIRSFLGAIIPIARVWIPVLLKVIGRIASRLIFFAGPVGIVVGLVFTLAQAFIALWRNSETFRDAVIGLAGAIQDIAVGAFDMVVGFFAGIPGMIDDGIAAVSDFARSVADWFRKLADRIERHAGAIRDAIVERFEDASSSAWEAVQERGLQVLEFLRSLPRRYFEALRDLLTNIRSRFFNAMEAARDAVIGRARAILNVIGGIPGRILETLGDLRDLLFDKGQDVLLGLLDGMRAAWQEVRDWLGGLGDQIKSLKGPIDVDRELLVPEGQAIMEGFQRGLNTGWERVSGWIGGRGGFIKGMFSGSDVKVINEVTTDAILGNITNPAEQLDERIPNLPRFWTSFTDMVQQADEIARMFGTVVTSTLRSVAENARVGGAVNSAHLFGQAVDFGGSTAALDNLAAWARDMERFFAQILWRVQGHFDHVHLQWAQLPRREHGGPVTGGEPYLVGEAGAEIFFPQQRGFVVNNRDVAAMTEMARMLKSGQVFAGQPQITVQSTHADPEVVAALVAANLSGIGGGVIAR